MDEYQGREIPISRFATFDVGVIGRKKHHIAGLVEVDITDARKAVKERIRAGGKISFNTWIIKCIGDTIAQDPQVQGMFHGRKRIISFADVDISIMVEKRYRDELVPLVAKIDAVNTKTIEQLFDEIEGFKGIEVTEEKDFVLDEKAYRGQRIYYRLPKRIRVLVMEMLLRNPFQRKAMMGTTIITNVGSMGNISGWIIPKSIHNICFGIGSINRKPWVVGDEVAIRDILHLTILFDHDIIDGAPAARFVSRLIRNLEHVHGIT